MGAIQEPTPQMGPYRTEISADHFWLTVKEPTATFDVKRLDEHTARIPVAHVPHIMAALYQVCAHPSWATWPGRNVAWLDADPLTTIGAERDGEHLLVTFAGKVYEQSWDDEDGADSCVGVEIEFKDIDHLRLALVVATA